MGRHLHEKYTESELNQIIFSDYTKPTTKFLLVLKGVDDYLFVRIFRQKEIKIYEDYLYIKTKFNSISKNFEDILLIKELNDISGY